MNGTLIPRRLLFAPPAFRNLELSPDGSRIAWLSPYRGAPNIWVRSIEETDEPHRITDLEGNGIAVFFWARNSKTLLYLSDDHGDGHFRLHAVDSTTAESRWLAGGSGARVQQIFTSEDRPDIVAFGLNARDKRCFDLCATPYSGGEIVVVAENPGTYRYWSLDSQLRPRAALTGGAAATGRALWLLHPPPSHQVRSWVSTDSQEIFKYVSAGNLLYLVHNQDCDTTALYTLDLNSGSESMLAHAWDVDIGPVLTHPGTRTIQAVGWHGSKLRWNVLDPSLQQRFDQLEESNAGDFRVVSRDRHDRRWLVGFVRDVSPPMYSLMSFERGSQAEQFPAAPLLQQYSFARQEPIRILARDGLELPSYLTLPLHRGAGPGALVLRVHGGPWTRDYWGFDSEVQWLADRGYACLQVNFRGSSGFGKALLNAGNKEWGGRMQEDLVDAVNWAIDNGIGSQGRIGILGTSYGGYAVLAALTSPARVFACGIAISPPSELMALVQGTPAHWATDRDVLDQRLGCVEKDAELLRSRSPFDNADSLHAPLLIAHGRNDPAVNATQSDRLVTRLRQFGKHVEYLEFPDEGHSFSRPEHVLSFYAAAEHFLAEHLKGALEPINGDNWKQFRR